MVNSESYTKDKTLVNETVMQHLLLLGMRVRDRVTGVTGVVTSVCYDLYGCIQAVVNRGVNENGELLESLWYDIGRLEVLEGPVMGRPRWTGDVAAGLKGSADKPTPRGWGNMSNPQRSKTEVGPTVPKVGDEVTWGWLEKEWLAGRHHVVRGKNGRAASFDTEVPGTVPLGRADVWPNATPVPLLALHPVERWEEPQPMPAVTRTIGRDTEIANLRSELQAVSDRVKELEALAQHAGSPPSDKNTPMEERRHAVTVAPGVMPEIVLDFDEALLDEVLLTADDFDPKEVMPDARDTTATEQPADLMDLGDVAARGDGESGGPAPVEAPARPPVVQGAVEGVTAAEQDAPRDKCACLEFWNQHHPDCPTPKGDEPRVMSTSGDGIIFNDDMDDIAVGDEPSVEEVLEWLDDPLNDMLMGRHRYAARIIREQKGEIERLTERLTITPEKEKAARGKVYVGSFSGDLGHVRAALRAAGMIDPEVEG